MGKLILAFLILSLACALFQWPGYLVRDDAAERVEEAKKLPNELWSKVTGEEIEEDPPDIPEGFEQTEEGKIIAKDVEYPFAMSIQNLEGVTLEVSVVGRGPDFIQFRRLSDERLFELRFDKLSEGSRAQVAALPKTLQAGDFGSATKRGIPANPRTSLADGIMKDIERNKARLAEQQALLRDSSATSSQKSMARKAMERLKAENAQLEAKAARYRADF